MDEILHSISTVSQSTGVNAITLRAWERRYGLVVPKRTPKGHRLFTDDDIVRIKEILFWLEKGITISKVGQYLQHKKQPINKHDEPDYSKYQKLAIQAVQGFDQNLLEEYMNEMFSLYPLDVISQKIYPKVLESLSNHWLTSDTAFSEQQFFSFYLRNKIATTFLKAKDAKVSGKIIVTTLEEAFSELELLFLAAALSKYGFEIILLGKRTLPHEWPKIFQKTNCKGLVISIDNIETQLQQVKHVGEYVNVPICVRTRTPLQNAAVFSGENVHALPENYHLFLARINEVMSADNES
jgi:DNA-binding transcriptional MerR regulator